MDDRPKARLKDMSLGEIKDFFAKMGEKPFRAAQLFKWMYAGEASSFGEMTNLPERLRRRLSETAGMFTLERESVRESRLDGTRKYLFRTWDWHYIESALMKYRYGYSICISTQPGCRMGCAF